MCDNKHKMLHVIYSHSQYDICKLQLLQQEIRHIPVILVRNLGTSLSLLLLQFKKLI